MKIDWKVVFCFLLWSVSVYPGLLMIEASTTGMPILAISMKWLPIIGVVSITGVTFFAILALIISLRDKKSPTIIYRDLPFTKKNRPFLP